MHPPPPPWGGPETLLMSPVRLERMWVSKGARCFAKCRRSRKMTSEPCEAGSIQAAARTHVFNVACGTNFDDMGDDMKYMFGILASFLVCFEALAEPGVSKWHPWKSKVPPRGRRWKMDTKRDTFWESFLPAVQLLGVPPMSLGGVAKKIPEMDGVGQCKTSEIVLPCIRERSFHFSTLTRQWANSGSNSGS